MSYRSYLLPLDHMIGLIEHTGCLATAKLERKPGGRVSRPHACPLARRPEKP
ncbi:hypothetical protein ACFYZB_44240 [Streptomyces sp. NPDC001852]|uniref:hypothetical protein n=1 Tax=Streptomyces sp. NPDC001852 TaxID=3364619 RepID=UPI0036BBD879